MYKLIIVLTFNLFVISIKSQVNWRSLNSGTTETLTYVDFINESTGFVVGNSGTILKTNDGGENWTKLNSGTNATLYTVSFFNDNIAYVCGEGGTILKSSDSGGSWTKLTSGTSTRLYTIYFVDLKIGYSAGLGGLILKTNDGGISWQQLNSATGAHIYRIQFLNKDTGFFVASGGIIGRTYNGGNTWEHLNSGVSNDLSYVNFYDKNIGFVTGDYGTILKTINGGDSWTSIDCGLSGYLNNIQYASKDILYVTGVNGTIIKSVNLGQNWVDDKSGVTNRLVSIDFPSVNTGYAVGLDGKILTNQPPCNGIKVNLGNDTTYCGPFTKRLNAGIAGTYVWSTNATSNYIQINSGGKFSVKVTTPNNCVAYDTINIYQYFPSLFNLGRDTFYCNNFNRVLDPLISGTYLWSTGETTRSILVKKEGQYSVRIIDIHRCSSSDTIVITQFKKPFIGNDTALCNIQNFELDGGEYQSYQWSTGETSRKISVNQGGKYSVVVKENNCYGIDTINVSNLEMPDIISIDTSVNGRVGVMVQKGKPPYSYSLDGNYFQKNEIFEDLIPGNYLLTVKDENDCYISKSFVVNDILLKIPNFFTPNGDGIHDTWEIIGIHAFPKAVIQIFDRFGKLLASYKGGDRGWNGFYNGKQLPSDDYWYIIDLKDRNKTYSGHLTLVR